MQPRTRFEGLLCAYLASLRFDFTVPMYNAPRRVGAVGPSPRTIVDVEPAKDGILEVAAKRFARKLKEYFVARQ